jgi:hypothetical protein
MVKKISQMKSKSTFSSIIGAVYIILSVLLLLCLAPMPYGYYQLVRFIAMTVFGVMAWLFYATRNTPGLCAPEEQKGYIKDDSTTILSKVSMAIVFGALALLFQPFLKISLGRTIWNIIDIAVVVLLIWFWCQYFRGNRNKIIRKE